MAYNHNPIRPTNRRPIDILCSPELPEARINLALSALQDLTRAAHTQLETRIVRGGRASMLLAGGKRYGREDQLHAGKMITKMWKDIIKDLPTPGLHRFELLLTDEDIYAKDTNYIFGIGQEDVGCVFSFHRFLELKKLSAETAKTVLMHELGHTFSLPARKEDIEESLGSHCIHTCLMRQGLDINEMVKITKDRLAGHVLCELCVADLIRYFWAPDTTRRNPDEELRNLERLAQTGDPQALEALHHAKLRCGQPPHYHDCDKCVYLGSQPATVNSDRGCNYQGYDLYFHQDTWQGRSNTGGSLIARYGCDPDQYGSVPLDVYRTHYMAMTTPAFHERIYHTIYQLAIKRGLIGPTGLPRR